MNKFLLTITIFILSVFTIQISQATVFFIQQEADIDSAVVQFTEGSVKPTDGDEGDFELLACATPSSGGNLFTSAEPNWDLINQGGCGGGPDCILGIFEKFSPQPNNISSTCIWNVPTNVFAGGVFRYGGADPENPVGDFACNSGTGINATAPSVTTTEGSIVTRFYISDTRIPPDFDSLPGSVPLGKFFVSEIAGIPAQAINLFGYNEPFAEAGIAPAVSIPFNNIVDDDWRACAVSIRMSGSPRISPIPTLNEWGLIAFAALAGISGLWFIRRRSVTA